MVIIVSVLLVTTMGTNVGASQNIVGTIYIAVRGDGFATPMGTAVITNTTVRNGILIGSTMTMTGSDEPKTPWVVRAPQGAGPSDG
jgi:hypothetical protein